MTHATDDPKRLPQARQTRPHQAKPRRLQKEREHLQREQARAPRPLPALEPALEELGRTATIVEEGQWQRRTQATRLGHIFGRMVPTCFGCRTPSELTRGRVWAKHLPGQVLGAWPTRQGGTHWQRWGQDVLETLWRPGEDTRPATRSRWPWTWGSDDRVCKTYGPRLGLGGDVVEWSRTPSPTGDRWGAARARERDRHTGHAGRLHHPSAGPRGSRPALP
jgi:hypothetical protein